MHGPRCAPIDRLQSRHFHAVRRLHADTPSMSYFAIIPAAGNGFRFGAAMPKQYLALQGKPVLQHAIDRMQAYFPLRHMYIVLAPEDHWFEDLIRVPENVTLLRRGGRTRAESVRNALAELRGAAADDWVLVHDAVRPCLDRDASLRLQRELADDDVGGFLAVPVSDTLKRLGSDTRVQRTEPRDGLWRSQTPQMFRYGVLQQAFAPADGNGWTDEAHAVEALGLSVRAIVGSPTNVKITFPEDMAMADAILSAQASGR
jgi:2-C-methyl-D-erythritol 4-phosphate cytidylyltransferase